jgi:hypothetical protein
MKKIIAFILVIIGLTTSFQSKASEIPLNNRSCDMARFICKTTLQTFDDRDLNDNCAQQVTSLTGATYTKPFYFTFSTAVAVDPQLSLGYSEGAATFRIYGPFTGNSVLQMCEQINSGQMGSPSVSFNGSISNVSGLAQAGTYIIEIRPSSCHGTIGIVFGIQNDERFQQKLSTFLHCKERFDCGSCVSSFSPPSGKYIVSAWVSEDGYTPQTTQFENSSIEISFEGDGSIYSLIPSGKIIDGWQKIENEITIPSAATSIQIVLKTESGNSYFDDVRFFPFDGSMMSYVFDPLSLRLMAELDERNYATLYEYDEEGKLIRVKKETEKGVMTIQENRDNIKKGQ